MDLDVANGGDLKVHYSERLVVLIREVRQLSELGYQIPREIQKMVQNAGRYYRYALQLKQVANF
jgi:dynein heavy chain 2